ncbi:MAG: hypothetical protein HYY16_15350 [Planctomycetes bacterium]|nr:hypothetical protein [Planctomycetota bacterium]
MIAVPLVTLVSTCAALAAQDLRGDACLEGWYGRVAGEMNFDEKPAVGDTVEFAQGLGARAFVAPLLETGVRFGPHRVSAGVERVVFRTREVLDRDRRWNETLWGAGETVETKFDVMEVRLGYDHALFDENGFALAAGLGARYVRHEIVLSSEAHGRDDDHVVALVPSLLARPRWRLSSAVELAGMLELSFLRTGDFDLAAFTVEMRAGWNVAEALTLWAGYRIEWLDVTKDVSLEKNAIAWVFDGLTFGADLRF